MNDERSYARLGSNQWLDRVGLNGIPLFAAARRSWVLREVFLGFSEEARTRGFASLALARFAYVNVAYKA